MSGAPTLPTHEGHPAGVVQARDGPVPARLTIVDCFAAAAHASSTATGGQMVAGGRQVAAADSTKSVSVAF